MNPTDTRTIPARFERAGYTHHLIARRGGVLLYACTRRDAPRPWEYEVLIVQRAKAQRTPWGRVLPPGERLPSSAQFGKAGWHMTDWETAWRLFNGQDARRGFNIRKKAGAAPLQLHPEFERFRNTRKRQLYDSLGRPADMVWERDPTEAAKSVQDWHAGAFSRGGAVLTLPGKQNLDVYKPPKIAGGF